MPACAHRPSCNQKKRKNTTLSYVPSCRFCFSRKQKGNLERISENSLLKDPIDALFPLAVTVDKEMADWICDWCKQSFLMYRELLVRTARLREEADPTYRASKDLCEEHRRNMELARQRYPERFRNDETNQKGAVQKSSRPQLPPDGASTSTASNTTDHPQNDSTRSTLKRKIDAGTSTVDLPALQKQPTNPPVKPALKKICAAFCGGKCRHSVDNSISAMKTREFNKLVESITTPSVWGPAPADSPPTGGPSSAPTPTPTFACKHCPRMFSTIQLLTWHNRTHLSRACITCRHCDIVVPKVTSLLYHMIREHGALKRTRCFLCQEQFTGYGPADLKVHELEHVRGRLKYACSFCPLICSTFAKLRAHRQKAHPDWGKRCKTAASMRMTYGPYQQ